VGFSTADEDFQNPMLKKTLRLWVACRFIESKWRCWSDSGRADNPVIAASPRDPFYDWDSLPPYLDYQIASIVIHRILTPLRKEVLRDLQGLFNTHFAKDWFATFLTTFILLQNYEMQMQFQKEFAARRKAPVSFHDYGTENSIITYCSIFTWTCRLYEPLTREPKQFLLTSTTATEDNSFSQRVSTGTHPRCKRWRSWMGSKSAS